MINFGYKLRFPFYRQLDSQDCGLACLRMISKYYNVDISNSNSVLVDSNLLKQGITISDLDKTSNRLGFNTLVVRLDFESTVENAPLPAIFFWNQNHFIVVYKITSKKVYVADPAFGKTVYSKKNFIKGWTQQKEEGIILLLEPTKMLFENISTKKRAKGSLEYVTQYLKKHNTQLFLIALTLLISSCIELIFPFFTQKILDKGVVLKDVSFIYLILTAQVVVFISKVGLEFYRSWLFIHISSRISLSIISDFLIKLMQLPLKFFNSKNIGDLTQRIQDHKRIEEFLSKDLIQMVFSVFSIIIYSFILLYFNVNIFLIVFIGTTTELLWIFSFLKKIKILDQKTFSLQAKDQNKIYELINSMQEIKLNNLEENKRKEWQKIQTTIYLNNIDKLKTNQQYESYRFISFFQTILVVFVSSMAVMNETLTVGSMLAIMFILGGINSPISQVINFVLQYQLVKASFERLNEIHNKSNEENISKVSKLTEIKDINIENVSFSYDDSTRILKNITLKIPKEKTTAIVGVSGSGKTTLLKLILKFYKPQQGNLLLHTTPLEEIENTLWRNKCGVILQDSFIFSDTISYNISLEENANQEKLLNAVKLSNVDDFIDKLPLKLNTIIGSEGVSISHGQRQRILIARAIYKNPDYLFFDEATNSLDAENERIIIENIDNYFKDKTMIVVAHRLSTVKNADQIIILDNGKIIEKGNHEELIKNRGKYFELIQNQLELGL
ncbi:ATP-binding cassette domain-containing protein [Elizabethkingia argentiflava]|uniref:ATP-binding cassette domain-containing protein n=1 Tax=Elizabethkingia argenteiflava TaxID=2681556 RepID=A0A845PVC5_9FLAO|nr:peptidase domain-containing ABC transporter [Elizabethkingia argenteiflava]NAW51605.1 ATP-binding cassette domain-containing protein [Elizabethkingia argenteiflava]